MTELDLAVLQFEKAYANRPGIKDNAIRPTLGISPNRYYQILNAVIDNPAALPLEPVLVNRLRRLREQRRQDRTCRALLLP